MRSLFVLATVLSMVMGGGAAGYAEYSVTPVTYPGASKTAANDVNDSGLVVGNYCTDYNCDYGFGYKYENGNFVSIEYPGSHKTEVHGTNNRGDVVGYYIPSGTHLRHGFVDDGDGMRSFDVGGAAQTAVMGINDAGALAGFCVRSNNLAFGFVYDGTSVTELNFPGAVETLANDINNAGVVVGDYRTGSSWHGFSYRNGIFTTYDNDKAGVIRTSIRGANDNGQLAGWYFESVEDAAHQRAFIYDGSRYIDLYPPMGVAQGINNLGVVVGYSNVFRSGYMMVPVNQKPRISPIGDQQGQEWQLLTFDVTATDPNESDVLFLEAANLPDGATFSPVSGVSPVRGVFTWTPSFDQAGEYRDVEFSVRDAPSDPGQTETAVESITITVGDVNRAPIFETVEPQHVAEAATLDFCVLAEDPDGDQVLYSHGPLPQGADFDGASLCLTWRPDFTQGGNHTLVFYATDDQEPPAYGQLEVAITVFDVPTPKELAESLVRAINGLDLPKSIWNSYVANIKKVPEFVDSGKVSPAINQLAAFVSKVRKDVLGGKINSADGNGLVDLAIALVEALSPQY